MKDIYYKKGRYLATIILILTVLIFGSVKLDYLNVQAESMDQGDENKLLEISQGDFMHRFVRGSEGLTFQLDVKDPELDVQYDWQILVPPMHGGATVFEEGTSIDVSYMPAENFFGEDNFLVEVSTTTGTRSKINVAVTVAPGEAQTEMENLRKPEGGEIALSPSFELEQKYPGDMAPERDRMDKPGVWKPNRYEDSDPRQDELDVLRDLDKKAQFDDNYRSAGIDGERSDPYFQVYPEWDEIDGYDWTPSTSVTLTIDSTVVATKESNDYGDVYFYLDPFDVLLGHVIEMTDGTYTRTHTVTSLTVTDIDEAADTISGTAEDGSEISVSANDDNGGDYLYPIADSFDNWSADFSGLVDIASGAYGYARQYDAEGNSTNIRWYIPDPYIEVYTSFDNIHGYDWLPNTPISLTIGVQEWIEESDSSGWVYFYTSPFDITSGQAVEMTDGTYTRTYTVTNLTVTDIDEIADTISGTAEAGSEISVSAHDDNGGDYLYPIADSFDNWSADFSGLVDIASGAYGYARQYDAEGNSTNIYWFVPDPYIEVYPEGDNIYGGDWTPNTSVTLSIGTQEWIEESNENGWVSFHLYPFDITAEQVVEMTDGTYTRTYTVTNLTVTDIDEVADTISGTAEAGSEISVSAHDDNGGDYLYPIADSFDNWSADFSGLVDIASGAYGYASQYDGEGNSTRVYWDVPDPYIKVYPQWDNIKGNDWIPNTPITLTIGTQEWIEESDEDGWVYFDTYPFDITAGQDVEMTDGTYTRTHTVTSLTVTDIDEIADTISGTAEAGSEISVSAHDDNGGDYLYPIADSFDNWSADFSGLVDIASGAFGYASQYDGEGNSTRVYWDVPDPYIKVYPEGDTVFGDVWTPDTTITLTIGTQEWIEESNEGGWVWFNISPFDITAGQVVEMTDGTYTRTHTVTNLTVTDVNEAADSVSGTAEPGSDVYVDGWDDWDYDYLTVTAEPSGDWTAAFTYLDVAPGASGDASQYDAEGNSTNIYWFVADPIFQVYPLGDYIYGYEWTPDTMVTATVGASTIGSGWSDGVGDVYFSAFFDLQPFDEVVLSDGTYTRTHVVKDIHVTEINQTSDMVFGTAEPLSELSHVSAYDGDDWSYRYPVADGSGNWSADFTGMIDIVPGSSGWAVQDDEARNETCIRWFVPDPYMRIYPEDDRVYGYAWPPDTTITLNIDGTEWIGVSSYSGWVMFYDETFDVQVGQTVTMLDGTFTQVHNVRPLSVTTIDDVNDTLSGTAKANDPVDVSACYYGCSNLTVTADGSGNWTADFNGIEDIEQGYSGSVIQYDPDGDSTRISWRLRDPAFEVHPGDNYIFGWDWSPNMPVTLEINSVLIATEESDPMGYVGFFPESFDIQPGQEIVLSDGTYTKTHTVIDLAVTTIDEVNDILNGTANPGTLTVDAYDAYNWETLYPVADTNGVWTVNFNTVDIAEGTSASIYQSDEDNDLTFIYWLIPDPKISERPQDDVVYGYSWPQNTEITLTIEYTRETLVEVETSNEHGSVYFFLDSFDLQPGDIVTMTAGTYTQEHIVRDISVTEIDQVLDTVSGTAEPGSEVQVCAYFYDGYYYTGACIITTADGSGIWQANFSGSVDIMAGSWGGVYQYDENNNYTYIYWEVSDEGYQIFLPLIVH